MTTRTNVSSASFSSPLSLTQRIRIDGSIRSEMDHLLLKSVFTRIVVLCSALVVLDGKLNAQAIPGQEINARKWSFSLTASAGISGIGSQMESSLKKSGFGDTDRWRTDFFFFSFESTNEYPKKTSSSVPWDMEIRYAFSPRHAVAAVFGNMYHSTVTGYNGFGVENRHYLTFETKVLQFSMDYIYTRPGAFSNFRIGPAMIIHQLTESGSTANPQFKSTIKPGLNLGYDAALITSKSFFMALSMGATLIPSVTVGSYSKVESGVQNGVAKTYTSTFKSSKVNLSSVRIGLTTGLRF